MTKIQLLIVLFLTFIAYSNLFGNQFIGDDFNIIVNWDYVHHLDNIPNFFGGAQPEPHTGYRPIRNVFIALSYSVWGTNPNGYRVVSILMHLANTMLVYLIASEIVGKSSVRPSEKTFGRVFSKRKSNAPDLTLASVRQDHNFNSTVGIGRTPSSFSKGLPSLLPLFVALVFGLHPIHTEAVSEAITSIDSIGYIFFLGSFWFYLKSRDSNRWYWVSVGLALLAYFAYELTLSLPLAILLWEIVLGKNLQKRLPYIMTYFGLAAFYFFVRVILLNVVESGGYLVDSFYKTMLLMTNVFVKYLALLVFPWNLSINHTIAPGIQVWYDNFTNWDKVRALSIFDPSILLNLVILGSLVGLGIYFRRKAPIIAFGIGWFFISLLPVSYLLPQDTIFQERYLYLGVLGFGLVVAYLIVQSSTLRFHSGQALKVQSLALFLVLAIALAYGVRTYVRNHDWKDEVTMWSKLVRQLPNDISTNFKLAAIYEKNGNLQGALKYYDQTLAIEPNIAEVYFRRGLIYKNSGEVTLARENFQKALPLYNNFVDSRFLLDELRADEDLLPPAVIRGNTPWEPYRARDKLLFYYPDFWKVSIKSDSGDETVLVISDSQSKTVINLTLDEKITGIEQYLRAQEDRTDELVSQGQAQIPNTDFAFAMIFDDGKQKTLQLFLFRESKAVKLELSPFSGGQNVIFDSFLSSISY